MSENLKHSELHASNSSSSQDPLSLDTSLMQAAEARMRRALGLEGGAPKQRPAERNDSSSRPAERFGQGHKRRFVQDGEVPVTVVSGRRDGPAESLPHRGPTMSGAPNRLEIAEHALAQEASARQHAERALADANAIIHDLRTKLGHAELARIEASDKLQAEREAIAALRTELLQCREHLQAAEAARLAAERAARRVERDSTERTPPVESEPAPPVARRAAPTRRTKPQATPAARSKLVRWWVKDDGRAE